MECLEIGGQHVLLNELINFSSGIGLALAVTEPLSSVPAGPEVTGVLTLGMYIRRLFTGGCGHIAVIDVTSTCP